IRPVFTTHHSPLTTHQRVILTFERGLGICPPFFDTTDRGVGSRVGPEGGPTAMNIAFCYESVLPTRGGCETYIAGLARRLAADGHDVLLSACRWDAAALPERLRIHPVRFAPCPRFLRPWFFSRACARAMRESDHQVTLGFDKIVGTDVLYPQGG